MGSFANDLGRLSSITIGGRCSFSNIDLHFRTVAIAYCHRTARKHLKNK